MRAYWIIFIALALVIGMYFNTAEKIEGKKIDTYETLRRMDTGINESQGIYNETEKITQIFNYTNLYQEKPTVQNVVYNVVNPIAYTVVKEMNTLIPLTMYIMNGEYAGTIMKIILIIIAIYLIFIIPLLIKTGVTIYFFIKERKKNKEKWYQ